MLYRGVNGGDYMKSKTNIVSPKLNLEQLLKAVISKEVQPNPEYVLKVSEKSSAQA